MNLYWNIFVLVELKTLTGVKQPSVCLLIAPLIRVVSVGVFVYVCVSIILPRRFLTAIVTVSAICS